jgi:DNA repair exonuclease SbcCD nuclease subunit
VHPPYAPCTQVELAAHGYEYWALGHVHAREVVSRDPWIVFPGNLQGRHVNEPGAKGATLVTVAEGRVVSAEHRAVDVFRWARVAVDVAGCDTEESALGAVQGALAAAVAAAEERGLAVRVTLSGATPLHGRLDRSGLREKVLNEARQLSSLVWIEGVELRTRAAATGALAERGDALGALARRIVELAEAPAEDLLGDWPAQLLGKLPPGVLAEEHALRDPAQVLARARDLVLARLAEA